MHKIVLAALFALGAITATLPAKADCLTTCQTVWGQTQCRTHCN